jgi:hypothetical protein
LPRTTTKEEEMTTATPTLEEVLEGRTDGAHSGEILVTQYQAAPIEDGESHGELQDALDNEILAGLVDL